MTRPALLAGILFISGLCALVFQTAWFRELRLVFGASTHANAAVLAIFMGGLGAGGLWLGPRVDRSPRPLRLYAVLELLAAVSAAVSPFLIDGVRALYAMTGGSPVLGDVTATLLRLGLSALVLAVPTIAMGGTLPAAVRAATGDADRRRVGLSLLYGANALGAVVGTIAGTFFLFEAFGTRGTLWAASALNALLCGVAFFIDARTGRVAPVAATATPQPAPSRDAEVTQGHVRFVLVAAAITGFVFFLMELVWYRMLAPLLGGSVFTFGLILATALLGIGAGALVYRWPGTQRRPSVGGFALTCAVEAAALGIPLALGDRVALLAVLLREASPLGFGAHVAGWAVVTALVVLPAAFVSGLQFPLLVGLLGEGTAKLGRQVGAAYAFNTGGAIAGSLVGGFLAVPLLGAVGAWRACAFALCALCLWAFWRARRERTLSGGLASSGDWPVLASAGLALLMALAPGPTSFWRHSPIGAGRGENLLESANRLERFIRNKRRDVWWERDGRESSLAMTRSQGIAFEVNGKTDGHSIGDGPTQVMGGLVGAFMHDAIRRVLVIGLGTGSTAGWLADLPTVERVDVVEIEPVVEHVARACAAVNRNVLDHPKVRVHYADAREVLLARGESYDLIFSEPSNPYRAGVASLFTREFYRAAGARLAPGGVFLQWLQAYEVDALTVAGVYATLMPELPHVITWTTQPGDLILAATREPVRLDVESLRRRMSSDVMREAANDVWRVDSVEGVVAHLVGDTGFAESLARQGQAHVNTDDLPRVEFAFARTVGRGARVDLGELHAIASRTGLPFSMIDGPLDHSAVRDVRTRLLIGNGHSAQFDDLADTESRARGEVLQHFFDEDFGSAAASYWSEPYAPRDAFERMLVAALAIEVRREDVGERLELVETTHPTEALILRALDTAADGDLTLAVEWLERAFTGMQKDPWVEAVIGKAALTLATNIGLREPKLARRLYDALAQPFAVHAQDEYRHLARVNLAAEADFAKLCAEALAPFEPHSPWTPEMLEYRVRCYSRMRGGALYRAATADLARYEAREPTTMTELLRPAPGL